MSASLSISVNSHIFFSPFHFIVYIYIYAHLLFLILWGCANPHKLFLFFVDCDGSRADTSLFSSKAITSKISLAEAFLYLLRTIILRKSALHSKVRQWAGKCPAPVLFWDATCSHAVICAAASLPNVTLCLVGSGACFPLIYFAAYGIRFVGSRAYDMDTLPSGGLF